jgi:hypothetical protein
MRLDLLFSVAVAFICGVLVTAYTCGAPQRCPSILFGLQLPLLQSSSPAPSAHPH